MSNRVELINGTFVDEWEIDLKQLTLEEDTSVIQNP